MKNVYLLGAGFSKAISPSMPLMQDLTTDLSNSLGIDSKDIKRVGGFERWMSMLAVRQPWHDEAEWLQSRALFLRASEALAEAIEKDERNSLKTIDLESISKIVNHWCQEQSTVITFNYDLLIERTVAWWEPGAAPENFYAVPHHTRPSEPGGLVFGTPAPDKPMVQLLKPHGSLNWFASQDPSAVGLPVTLPPSFTKLNAGIPSDPKYADLRSLLVPPAALKDSFYAPVAIRHQWKKAAEALRECDRLTIIGYSFPDSDATVRNLITTELSPDAEIVIVDPSEQVAKRVGLFWPRNTHIPSLEAWKNQLEDCLAVFETLTQPDYENPDNPQEVALTLLTSTRKTYRREFPAIFEHESLLQELGFSSMPSKKLASSGPGRKTLVHLPNTSAILQKWSPWPERLPASLPADFWRLMPESESI